MLLSWIPILLLADAGNGAGGAGGAAAPQGDPGGIPFYWIALIVIGVLFYMVVWRPEQRKQRSARDQLSALKKNDRVVTIGGIYGVVANIHRDADKITLKVDDNTKIDFALSAISRVLSDGADEKDSKKEAAAKD